MNLMMVNTLNSSAVQRAEASSSNSSSSVRPSAGIIPVQQVQDDLRAAALRMRLEMPLKERIVHLQTFKYTFTGQQAVVFLQQQGLAGNRDAAADMCQRMLTQGLFKSIYHREVFVPDGEIYRFSSSFPDGSKQKARIPGSITSTGLYKEIAKFGKSAAQPFKNIQLSLNDTLNSLGGLSIPTPPKPGQLVGSLSMGRPRASSTGAARTGRRSQAGKLHVYGDTGVHGTPDTASSLAALVANMDALQASIKESTSLLRLDLQQHTALQEHLVGILMSQQEQLRCTQLLIALNATAALLMLGFSGSWPATLAAGCLLAVLLYAVAPEVVRAVRQPAASAGGGLLRRSSVTSGRVLEPQMSRLSRLSRLSRSAAGAPARAAEGAGLMGGFHAGHDSAGEQESDDVDDIEDSTPYSEDFDDWPDAPVMLCPDPSATQQEFAAECPGPCHALPVNGDPIPFETELFKGVVAVFIRHLPTTPLHLFKGKKRLAWVALQGTFKQPVSMDTLVYGMEFSRQLVNLPAPWFLENMLLPLARKISPSMRVGTLEDPYFFSPMITASQVVNVALPGQGPALMEAKEDMRLLQQELGGRAGDGLSVSARRKYFQVASHRRQMEFGTQYVWTFHLWQEYIDYAAYLLSLGYSSYDLTQHLDAQPLQVMAKDESSGQHLISLQVWHANLVRSMGRRMPRAARMSRLSNASIEDALHDRSVQVTQGGLDPEAAAAAAGSPYGTPQPSQGGSRQQALLQQQEQQQQQQHSSPLPCVEVPHQAGDAQQHCQQQQDAAQQTQQHELLHKQVSLQQVHHADQQGQPQQQLQQALNATATALPAGSPMHSSRGSHSTAHEVQQSPLLISLSDSRLQRPVGLHEFQEASSSGSSKGDSDGPTAGRTTLQQQQQPSTLRPPQQQQQQYQQQQKAVSPVLHGHLSLPAQQLGRHELAEVPSLLELQSMSTAGSSIMAVHSGTGGSSAAGAALVGRSESWTAATAGRAPADSRPARLSSAADMGRGNDGFDSPQASRTPGWAGGGASSHATAAATATASSNLQPTPQQQQQTSQTPQSSKKKKKNEQKDKEDQQRQQLHGLSVMGAL